MPKCNGSRPRSGHSGGKSGGGRVTRSAVGKIPLGLKSCDRLQNSTPHKIIKVKEVTGNWNSLQTVSKAGKLPDLPRRSSRKNPSEIRKEETKKIEERLLLSSDDNAHLEVVSIPKKGRGIIPTKPFVKGEFVVEYAGKLVEIGMAKELEAKYSLDSSKGCFMFYFKNRGKQYCIDATIESGRFGRLVNHSRVSPNCVAKVVMLGETPRLILVARQDIAAGVELLYDYGDRSKASLKAHPWLAQ